MQTDYLQRQGETNSESVSGHSPSGLDRVGYGVAIALALYLIYLWTQPELEADPRDRFTATWSAPSQTATQQPGKPQTERSALVSAPVASRQVAGLRQAAQQGQSLQTLERLLALSQQPGWSLLESDISAVAQALQELMANGTGALPFLQHYLSQSAGGEDEASDVMLQLGYPSMRLALFDVVRQIGGHQAEDILYRSLQQSASPLEIETLGRYLEQLSPGLYAPDILDAARARLLLAEGDPGKRLDAGPLFQVIARYGDPALAAELERASPLRWGQYAAVTLSRLPAGAGMEGLARRVEAGPSGNTTSVFALNLLAQSAEYPEAQQALIDSVRTERIAPSHWPEIARLLMGTYHIQLEPPQQGLVSAREHLDRASVPLLKSQKYVSLSPGGPQVLFGLQLSEPVLAAEQILPRLELINALLSETQNPVAKQELLRAEHVLWGLWQRQQEL